MSANDTTAQATAKHTPGPWRVAEADWVISQKHGFGNQYFPIRCADYEIGTVWCDEDDAEQAANVRLVAGAPEMLDLLRRIVAAQEQFFTQNESGSHDEFQRAADEFHDSIDRAAAWIEQRGL